MAGLATLTGENSHGSIGHRPMMKVTMKMLKVPGEFSAHSSKAFLCARLRREHRRMCQKQLLFQLLR